MKKGVLLVCVLLGSFLSFGQDKDIPFNKESFSEDKAGFSNAVKEIKLGDIHFYRGTKNTSYCLLGEGSFWT